MICVCSSATRSGANGSVVSSTACTNEPKAAPAGSCAIGEGTSAPAGIDRKGISSTSSSSSAISGSLDTPDSSAARSSPEYDVRRQAVSIGRSNTRTARSSEGDDVAAGTNPVTSASSITGPPWASQARSRLSASASEILAGEHLSGTDGFPGARPRNSRDSPPLGSSKDGAHHATTWDCARVSAT
ncbi:Uncharacterised protein [Mycobacteroides abscessus subsp. abscessus]|nr:Uncharacterised protein [Mycobacteroides abscessus subsp. abscessus]